MSMQDPIADLLTRIRNAGVARHVTCGIGHSKVKERICALLSSQGYLGATAVEGDGPAKTITVTLKYAMTVSRSSAASTASASLAAAFTAARQRFRGSSTASGRASFRPRAAS